MLSRIGSQLPPFEGRTDSSPKADSYAGTYAEMAAVKESFLTETPSNIEDDVAGATPLVALTALQVRQLPATSHC